MKCDKLVKLYADLPRKDIRLLTTTTDVGLIYQAPTLIGENAGLINQTPTINKY